MDSILGNYHDLYPKSDILLMAGIFENFRHIYHKTYNHDPAHSYSTPGLAWIVTLRTIKIELGLLIDIKSQWCNLTLARGFWGAKVCLRASKISKMSAWSPD